MPTTRSTPEDRQRRIRTKRRIRAVTAPPPPMVEPQMEQMIRQRATPHIRWVTSSSRQTGTGRSNPLRGSNFVSEQTTTWRHTNPQHAAISHYGFKPMRFCPRCSAGAPGVRHAKRRLQVFHRFVFMHGCQRKHRVVDGLIDQLRLLQFLRQLQLLAKQQYLFLEGLRQSKPRRRDSERAARPPWGARAMKQQRTF